MIPELGLICLIIALLLSLLQAGLTIYAQRISSCEYFVCSSLRAIAKQSRIISHLLDCFAIARNDESSQLEQRRVFASPCVEKYYHAARPLSLAVTFFITLAFIILLYSLAQDDFSLKYVVMHSNSALPLRYKLSALWAGHEGSLLLWVFMLSLWMLCFNLSAKALPKIFVSKVLSYLACIIFGFLLFILTTSNPFLRELPLIPLDGLDLNPLLQDPGLIFHPPLLYMGYVGSAIVASFAVAALWENKLYPAFAAWVRPWVLASFGFLTVGIAWGSYWAYYELGWGGWWFWDPVENASLMPWLILLALIHSLIVLRKRQELLRWTLLLMILSFAFCLLGTFLVRSGILSSVHTFATDPKRGIFIFLLSCVLIGIAFGWYIYRSRTLVVPNKIMELTSREALLLLNTILIVVTAASILLGTLFPLGYEFFTQKKISVGFPYFNLIFIILMIPVLLSIPLGPFLHWGANSYKTLVKKMSFTLLFSLFLSTCLIAWLHYENPVPGSVLSTRSLLAFFGFFLGFWVMLGTLQRLKHKLKLGGVLSVSVGAWGMILAHFGIGVMIMGVTMVSQYQIEKDVRLSLKDSVELSNYQINFQTLEAIEGENYVGYRGYFTVTKQGKMIAKLVPEKRTYVVQNTSLSETAIDANFWRDIYIALGEQLSKDNWTIRIYYKPGVRWIWLGACLVALSCAVLLVFRTKKP